LVPHRNNTSRNRVLRIVTTIATPSFCAEK
jgi:hypothetical protein